MIVNNIQATAPSDDTQFTRFSRKRGIVGITFSILSIGLQKTLNTIPAVQLLCSCSTGNVLVVRFVTA